MRIKLALLEKDSNYLKRIATVFGTKYADKLEVYSFTDLEAALGILDSARIDVFIASDMFHIDVTAIPKRCGFAYFVDAVDIDTINGQRAIGKFQKADLIYKQILSIFSENAANVSGLKMDDDSTKVIAFTSPAGGVGTSTMAAACAIHFAASGKKTLYLNLEKFGSPDAFFSGEGQFDMSDIIFGLKSKKANLPLKLESCVKHDQSGVCFYSQAKLALDMLELTNEDIVRLITELKVSGTYDAIILDMDFSMERETLEILQKMHTVVLVSDGSELANIKVFRAYNALATVEQQRDLSILNKLCLVYNKFSSKTGKALDQVEIANVGGAPRYEHAATKQVVAWLAGMNFFDRMG